MTRLAPILLALLAFAPLGGCGDAPASGGAAPILRFTAIPGEDPTRMKEKFGPVADWLSEQLGVPVEYVHATKYAASVEMFKNEQVLLAWFGGLTGVQARAAVPGARAIAQGVEDPRYHSYFIANASTGLERGEGFPVGIVGRSFTFGSKSSTSGRLMPEHFIRQQSGGASPAEYLKSDPQYSDGHDKTCELVQSGAVDVGVVSYTTYDRRVAEGTTDPKVCRIIWQTPDYPDYNFTAHPKLETLFGAGFTAKLQAALLAMNDEALLAGFQRSGMVAATNEDFQPIEVLARDLGLLR
ncbi:MAG: putative selenate ABC transporter substrate-binding protein [Planctomycetota bacterium]|nr:putative selenate ABC transporter substrate-binding protein [Planctomycetota bacterium]